MLSNPFKMMFPYTVIAGGHPIIGGVSHEQLGETTVQAVGSQARGRRTDPFLFDTVFLYHVTFYYTKASCLVPELKKKNLFLRCNPYLSHPLTVGTRRAEITFLNVYSSSPSIIWHSINI